MALWWIWEEQRIIPTRELTWINLHAAVRAQEICKKKKKNQFPASRADDWVLLILSLWKWPLTASQWKHTNKKVTSKGRELEALVIFPLISSGPRLAEAVITDCLCSQLCPVYAPFPSALGDAYITQHKAWSCLPQNNPSALLFPALAFPVLPPVFRSVSKHHAQRQKQKKAKWCFPNYLAEAEFFWNVT